MSIQSAAAIRLLDQSAGATRFPEGPFDPQGNWKHVYHIDVIWRRGKGSDSVNSASKEKQVVLKIKPPGGFLAIAKEKIGNGLRYRIDYQLKMSRRDEGGVRGEIVCKDDPMLTPLSWTYRFAHQPKNAALAEYAALEEAGRLKDGQVFKEDRPLSVGGPLKCPANEWTLFDLVQVLSKKGLEDELSFDMLESFTIPRRGQRLVFRGVVKIATKSGPKTLREYVQIGQGLQPRHYLLDEHGRLLVVSDFFRIFQLVEESA